MSIFHVVSNLCLTHNNRMLCALCVCFQSTKAKAVPLHSTTALARREGIAPAHSRLDGVSGQRHDQAAL
jgi:hypothetical protein